MNEHEESIHKSDDEAERRPRPAAPAGERGLSPPELLRTLIDGPPTEGDLQMLLELRAGLRADPSGPATVIDCGPFEPLDPETVALLHRLARERLRRLTRRRSWPGDAGEDR